jgi:hypothetical protein
MSTTSKPFCGTPHDVQAIRLARVPSAIARSRELRLLGFLVNARCKVAARPLPPAPLGRVNRSFRRRLNDSMELLFDEACVANKLSAAADLLALLERWHSPRQAGYGGERRISDATLERMRHKLKRLYALCGRPGAGSGAYPSRDHGNRGEPAPPVSGADVFADANNFGSHEVRDGYRQYRDVIDRLTAEIESKNGMYRTALARIAELEALLRFPIVRKALLRALHPDTHPDMSDSERRAITAQFQKTLAQLNNLGAR